MSKKAGHPLKNYVVIDLEMCKVHKSYAWKDYHYANEIIQIGAVMLNEHYEQVGEFSSYVCPQYGKIDHFIENLTGIRGSDVRHAPSLGDVLRSMRLWIGNKDVIFYSWSDMDYFQIRGEILAKGYDETEMNMLLNQANWIDYQKVLKDRFDMSRILSLSDALTIAELDPEGRAHDGLDDAYNTARIIAKIEMNPDYQFTIEKLSEKELTPLCTSLGDLLQGLNLGAA